MAIQPPATTNNTSKWQCLNQNIDMAKKVFLNRERAIPTAQVPSVRREETDSEVASSRRNTPVLATSEQLPFSILD
jgi:hypothetical protein